MSTTLASLFKHPFFDRLGIVLVGSMLTGALLLLGYELLKASVWKDELHTVTGTLLEDPKVFPARRYTNASIKMKLSEYPPLLFSAGAATNGAMDVEAFIRDVHRGDSVRLQITKEVYRKQISHEETPGFFDLFFDDNKIELYGVESKNNIYLQPGSKYASSIGGYLFLLVLLTAFGYYLFRDVRHTWNKNAGGKKQFR